MRLRHRIRLLGLALFATAIGSYAGEASAPPVAGLELGTITVGKTSYHEVRVRSRDQRSLFFLHRDGLGSARLRDLAPDIQARLGYDPASAPPEPPPPAPRRVSTPSASAAPAQHQTAATSSVLEELFLSFDRAPELRAKQTLQPEFIRLGLAVKNQGRRPSCAIFAIVSALEFQNARLTGSIEKLSEEYLVWATRRSLGLTGPEAVLLRDPATGELAEDAGFSLPSVIAALQTYGVPRYDDMRNQPGLAVSAVPEPSPEIIERARGRRRVLIASLPGRDPASIIPRIVQALNAEIPVPLGLRWPNERSIHAGVLAAQQPVSDAFHAVTAVGYECPTGRIEDTTFVFKNSYGPRWGQGGYGRVSYRYLSRNLLDAYVLDVRPPAPRRDDAALTPP